MQADGYAQGWTGKWRQMAVYRDFVGLLGTAREGYLVPVEGIEPTLPFSNQILSLARLPIPPHRHDVIRGPKARVEGRAQYMRNLSNIEKGGANQCVASSDSWR